jgi:hypothetical protein
MLRYNYVCDMFYNIFFKIKFKLHIATRRL